MVIEESSLEDIGEEEFERLAKRASKRKQYEHVNVSSVSELVERGKTLSKTYVCPECQLEVKTLRRLKCGCGKSIRICNKCYNEHIEVCDFAFCHFCTFNFNKDDNIIFCELCKSPLHDYCIDGHLEEVHPKKLVEKI